MPETRIILTRTLAAYADGQTRLSVSPGTLHDVISELHERYPHLAGRLVSDSLSPLPFVGIYIDGDKVPAHEPITAVQVAAGVEVSIVQAVAGG